jgi:hypothetical protein
MCLKIGQQPRQAEAAPLERADGDHARQHDAAHRLAEAAFGDARQQLATLVLDLACARAAATVSAGRSGGSQAPMPCGP